MSAAQSTVTYRDIPEFPGYRVGDDGSVWSSRPRNGVGKVVAWRKLNPSISKTTKRYVVTIRESGVKHSRHVHTLVLTAFHGDRPNGLECRHLDGNKLNNKLSNLVWGTQEQNTQDRFLHGTTGVGESNPAVKLTEKQVVDIITRRRSGERGVDLAKEYRVSPSIISLIHRNKKWKHLR